MPDHMAHQIRLEHGTVYVMSLNTSNDVVLKSLERSEQNLIGKRKFTNFAAKQVYDCMAPQLSGKTVCLLRYSQQAANQKAPRFEFQFVHEDQDQQ